MPRYASLDIGTQTIRLLIADTDSTGKYIPVYRDRAIIRLGEGLGGKHCLQPKPMQRALTCVKNFINISHHYQTEKLFAVATSCVREAVNGTDFLKTIYRETGVVVRLLSGTEEANLSLRGVQSVFNQQTGYSLVIDIGGGSTELILTNGMETDLMESLPLGVVHLSEEYLRTDPPRSEELSSLTTYINNILLNNCNCYTFIIENKIDGLRVMGTAGTVTTLAAMALKMTDYDSEKINGCVLTRAQIQQIYEEIILIHSKCRINLPGLEHGREVVIIPGTKIALSIMDLFGATQILVSDAGLLEGILLEAIGVNA